MQNNENNKYIERFKIKFKLASSSSSKNKKYGRKKKQIGTY